MDGINAMMAVAVYGILRTERLDNRGQVGGSPHTRTLTNLFTG